MSSTTATVVLFVSVFGALFAEPIDNGRRSNPYVTNSYELSYDERSNNQYLPADDSLYTQESGYQYPASSKSLYGQRSYYEDPATIRSTYDRQPHYPNPAADKSSLHERRDYPSQTSTESGISRTDDSKNISHIESIIDRFNKEKSANTQPNNFIGTIAVQRNVKVEVPKNSTTIVGAISTIMNHHQVDIDGISSDQFTEKCQTNSIKVIDQESILQLLRSLETKIDDLTKIIKDQEGEIKSMQSSEYTTHQYLSSLFRAVSKLTPSPYSTRS